VSTYYKYDDCDNNTSDKTISQAVHIQEAGSKDYCIYNIREIIYKNNHHVKGILYDTNKNGARIESYYKKETIIKKMYYDNNGKLLGTYYLPSNGNEHGIKVSYYNKPMRPKEIITVKDDYLYIAKHTALTDKDVAILIPYKKLKRIMTKKAISWAKYTAL